MPSSYSITYKHSPHTGNNYAGFTTDEQLWKAVLDWCENGDSQFQTGEEGYVGEYNDEIRAKMEHDGGIGTTASGEVISKGLKRALEAAGKSI